MPRPQTPVITCSSCEKTCLPRPSGKCVACENKRVGHRHKSDSLTTGDVARIMCVSRRMVCDWIDAGRMVGWKVPFTSERRVHIRDLIAFMEQHKYPAHMIPALRNARMEEISKRLKETP